MLVCNVWEGGYDDGGVVLESGMEVSCVWCMGDVWCVWNNFF